MSSNNVLDHRGGDWLPQSTKHTHHWLAHLVRKTDDNPAPLHSALKEFETLVNDDSTLYMLATGMFDEVPDQV
jgi:phosphatidylserine decarboxylase